MKPRCRFVSSLVAALAVACVGAEAQAQCTARIQVSGPAPTLASSPYEEGPTTYSWEPAHWFDDDRRVVEVYFRPSILDAAGRTLSLEELRASLQHLEVFVLRSDIPEQTLLDLPLPAMAHFLRASTSAARITAMLAPAEHWEWIDTFGKPYVNANFTLSPSDQLAPGEYWLVAAIWLPKSSPLGCPDISPEGVFSQPVRLIIRATTTVKERAFVQYRRIRQALALHAIDIRNPDYRHASPEQVAVKLDAALDAAKKLIAIDTTSALGWEMLARVHDIRHEAAPAIAAYRKTAELLAADGPDIAPIDEGSCWPMPHERRPARLQQRIDALSLPQPRFEDAP